ncbi:unnamed protein product [Schistosoma curassoni]|uniref:C2H2-type domain-containing protein n=1 Tax=Schistosoma curassoni TaxID=6186 RepID=A0A183K7E6_9TREM|nr:unnamed protein product [Schistosoma curassoni]
MRLHWGVKPFICVFCPYRSAWKGDLKRHMESHHRERFTCETELIKIMSQFKNNAGTRTSAAAASMTSGYGHTSTLPISQFDITTESSEGDNTSDRYNCLHIDEEEENIIITTTSTTTTTTTTTTTHDNNNSSNNSLSIDVENSDDSSNESDDKMNSIVKSYSRKHSLKTNYSLLHNESNSMDTINNINGNNTNSSINSTVNLTNTMLNNYLPQMTIAENSLICHICSYHAQNQSKFKNHMASHINLKQFKCPICGQRSNYKWDITKHLKKQHPNSNQLPITIINNDIETIDEQYMTTSIGSIPISLTMYSTTTSSSSSSSSLPMTSLINSQSCTSQIQSCILPSQSSIVSLIPIAQPLTVFSRPQITSITQSSLTSSTTSHLSCLSGISPKSNEMISLDIECKNYSKISDHQMTSNDPLNLIAYSSIKQLSLTTSSSSSIAASPSKNSSLIQNDEDDDILSVNDSLPIDLSIGYPHKHDDIKVKLTFLS